MQRFFKSAHIVAALILSATILGFLAKPAHADIGGLVSQINSYRQSNGLGTLAEDQKLVNAACWFSNDMGAKNYFPSDHIDSLGRTMVQRLTAFGVNATEAENIFYTTAGSSANYAFDAWKNSPGHNANMLGDNYTRIGIGRTKVNGRWYWVTDFASGTSDPMTLACGETPYATPAPAYATPKTLTPKTSPAPTPAPTTTALTTAPIVTTPTAATTSATKSATLSVKRKVATFTALPTSPRPDSFKTLVASLVFLINLPVLGIISLGLVKPPLLQGIFKFLSLKF